MSSELLLRPSFLCQIRHRSLPSLHTSHSNDDHSLFRLNALCLNCALWRWNNRLGAARISFCLCLFDSAEPFKLASRPRTRSRRTRRAAASTAKGRLPVGAPGQAKPITPYSHIQIVPEETEFTDNADYKDDTPTYRSTSLQYLAPFDETSHRPPTYNKAQRPAAPTSSGQTFADMARRANSRELYDGQEPPTSGPVPLAGLIKFKANRNKGNKAWRPLHLSDFDDDKQSEEDLPQAEQDTVQPLTSDHYAQNVLPQPGAGSSTDRSSVFSLPKLQTDIHNHPIQHHQIVASDRFSIAQALPPLTMFQQDHGDDISPKNTRTGTDDETIQFFGRRLPDPIYLQQVMGTIDGEVTFIGHPNRDVSAHQWSAASFQWSNIGQFSHIRRKVEGQLASDRLRGQAIGMSIPQNTLAYFKAIAEQRGMIMMKSSLEKQQPSERFSEVGFMMPRVRAPIDSSRRPTLAESDNFGSLSSASGPAPGGRFPTLGNLAVAREARLSQWPPTAPSLLSNMDILADDPFITSNQFQSSMPASAAMTTPPNRGSAVPSRLARMDFNFEFPSRTTNQWRPDSPQTPAGDEARKEFFARQEQERIRQDLWPQERQAALQEICVGEDAAGSLEGSSQNCKTFGQEQELSPEHIFKRERLKERLYEFGNLAGSRAGITTANRVAIPDLTARIVPTYNFAPAFPPGFEPPPLPAQASQTSTLNANAPPYNHTNFLNPHPPHTSSDSPTLTNATATTTNLKFSEPDTIRPSHVPEIAPGLAQQAPTPQNFTGPFFADTIPTAHAPTTPLAPRLAEPEKLEMWWTNGQQPARQEAFYHSIMSTAAANARIRGGGGNANTTSGSNSGTNSNSITNRLLVPLYENLRLYADESGGSARPRNFYSRHFAPPPPYAIDRALCGNETFFGDDCGAPPPRFGRDPRYQFAGVAGELGLRGGFGGGFAGLGLGMRMGLGVGMGREFGGLGGLRGGGGLGLAVGGGGFGGGGSVWNH